MGKNDALSRKHIYLGMSKIEDLKPLSVPTINCTNLSDKLILYTYR